MLCAYGRFIERQIAHVLFLTNRFISDPSAAIERIADYLGIATDANHISRIADLVSFERLKRFSRHIEQLTPLRLVRSEGYVFDRETLLHHFGYLCGQTCEALDFKKLDQGGGALSMRATV